MRLETLFTILLTVQFLAVVVHDWLDIPGWTHGKQVQAAIGRSKLLAATLINAVFPGLAVAFRAMVLGQATPEIRWDVLGDLLHSDCFPGHRNVVCALCVRRR